MAKLQTDSIAISFSNTALHIHYISISLADIFEMVNEIDFKTTIHYIHDILVKQNILINEEELKKAIQLAQTLLDLESSNFDSPF